MCPGIDPYHVPAPELDSATRNGVMPRDGAYSSDTDSTRAAVSRTVARTPIGCPFSATCTGSC